MHHRARLVPRFSSSAAVALVTSLLAAGCGEAEQGTLRAGNLPHPDPTPPVTGGPKEAGEPPRELDAAPVTYPEFRATNLALGKRTLPPSAATMVDGALDAGVSFGSHGMFVIDLAESLAVGRAIFSQAVGKLFAQAISLSASDDNRQWREVWRGASPVDYYEYLEAEVVFPTTTARYWRVTYDEPANPEGIRADEFALYGPDSSSANLALGKHASASVHTQLQSPDRVSIKAVTDGRVDGAPWLGTWKPAVVTLDLAEVLAVDRVRLLSDTTYAATSSTFELSIDGEQWTVAASSAGGGMHDVHFPTVAARYVRCGIYTVQGSDSYAPGIAVRELQVYGPGVALD